MEIEFYLMLPIFEDILYILEFRLSGTPRLKYLLTFYHFRYEFFVYNHGHVYSEVLLCCTIRKILACP